MAYYRAFREKYPGISKAQKQWEATAIRTKMVKQPTGLVYHYPNASMNSGGYNKEWPSICNYAVQGLATAEIIPIALTAMWHVMSGMDSFINNTVHDSVVIESPDNELEEVYKIGKWAFLNWVYNYLDVVYDIQFNVPLGVGYQAGPNWGTAAEVPFTPVTGDNEVVSIKDNEVSVTTIPPTRMAGVDYSTLEK